MGMRGHPRGDFAFVGVTPTQADVAYQPAAILNTCGSSPQLDSPGTHCCTPRFASLVATKT